MLGMGAMHSPGTDIRYAFRSFRRAPAFFGLITAILALGIAASVSVFSLVDGVLLRALPYKQAERLVRLDTVADRPQGQSNGSMSYDDFEQLRAGAHSFDDLAATYRGGWSMVTLTGGAEPERMQGSFASPNLFAMFGRSPGAGRVFTEDENRRGEHVLVLSEGLAIRQFGSAALAIGQDLEIDRAKWTVIGVMPADFRVPFLNVQLWAPLMAHPGWIDKEEGTRPQRWDVYGRLRQGATVRAAQPEVDGIESRLKSAEPQVHRYKVRVVPLLEYFTADVKSALWVLFAAVGCLLLITCANVANLLLARAATRGRELAVRVALGADRLRLVQQIVVESLTVCAIAGVLGVAAAFVLLRMLKALAPAGMPRLEAVQIDARVFVFAVLLVVATGALLGMISAWKASRRAPREFLGASSRSASENRESRRLKGFLVAAEFALAMVLLTGSALLIRSLVAVLHVDLGFHPENVLTVNVNFPAGAPAAQSLEAGHRMLEEIQRIPGVQAAGAVRGLFFLDETRMHALRQVEGRASEPVTSWKQLVWSSVSGNYFQAMGIPLLRGRNFNDADGPDAPPVVIVNQTLAERYWPGEDPVGRRIKGFDTRGKNDEWLTVAGVVGDTRSGGVERRPFSQVYELQAQRREPLGSIIIRTSNDPASIAAGARAAVRQAAPGVVISSIETMQQLLGEQEESRRFQTWLIGVFSAIALALAALGVFAVMHYTVAAKSREIGIRMAVGARPGDILRLVLGEGARLAGTGIAAGALGGMWTMQAVAAWLYQVQRTDPLSFAAAAVVLAGIGMAACYLPARRAMRVDPVGALRNE